LRISPQALEEIDQAFDYYSKISEQVAFNFHEELGKSSEYIRIQSAFSDKIQGNTCDSFSSFSLFGFLFG